MPKRLIINSDDYGRSPEISQGIRLAHRYGVVTSTTCMMNIPTTADDVRLAVNETPGLGMGVHLVLTMGKPISLHETVRSLTDDDGYFFKYTPFVKNLPRLDAQEAKAEWRAQIETFIAAAGEKPDHLDSHHHSSYFSSELFRAMLELAQEYDCPIRFPFTGGEYSEFKSTKLHVPALIKEFNPRRPNIFLSDFYDQQATLPVLHELLLSLQDGDAELMCHVGFVLDAFMDESSYNKPRQRELGILLDPAVRKLVEALEIQLITFADL